jgi:hypothetical protein
VTKLLEEAIVKVRQQSEHIQDMSAGDLKQYLVEILTPDERTAIEQWV